MIYNKKDNAVHNKVPMAPNFTPWEFRCKCNICQAIILDLMLPVTLERMRGMIGRPIVIESGYRCPRYNEVLIQEGLPASKVSKHIMGTAADIYVVGDNLQKIDGHTLARYAYLAGFRAIGVAPSWIHVDLRQPQRWALWTYGQCYDLKWLRTFIEGQ